MGLPNQKHLMCDTDRERDKEYIELTDQVVHFIYNYERTSYSHIRARYMIPRCTYSPPPKDIWSA